MTQRAAEIKAVWWMGFAAFCFSVMGALVKELKPISSWEVLFFRSFINVVLLVPWLVRERKLPLKGDLAPLLLRGFSGCFAAALFFYAISVLPLANAVLLNYLSPLFVSFFSYMFFKERISLSSVLFIVLALLGTSLILKPDLHATHGVDRTTLMAGIAGLLSAIFAAIAYLSIRVATKRVSNKYIVFSFALVSSIVSFPFAVLNYTWPSQTESILLLCCGLVASTAQMAMTRGYSGLRASTASPILLLTVLFSAVWGVVFWGEVPDVYSVFGGGAVILGLLGIFRNSSKYPQSPT